MAIIVRADTTVELAGSRLYQSERYDTTTSHTETFDADKSADSLDLIKKKISLAMRSPQHLLDDCCGYLMSMGFDGETAQREANRLLTLLSHEKDAVPPKTWDEAVAQTPGLMKWEAAALSDPKLSILDHLRDRTTGYGRWTAEAPGLPLKNLHDIDPAAHRKLYNEGHHKNLPPDIHLLTKKAFTDVLMEKSGMTAEDLRRVGHTVAKRERAKVDNKLRS